MLVIFNKALVPKSNGSGRSGEKRVERGRFIPRLEFSRRPAIKISIKKRG